MDQTRARSAKGRADLASRVRRSLSPFKLLVLDTNTIRVTCINARRFYSGREGGLSAKCAARAFSQPSNAVLTSALGLYFFLPQITYTEKEIQARRAEQRVTCLISRMYMNHGFPLYLSHARAFENEKRVEQTRAARVVCSK